MGTGNDPTPGGNGRGICGSPARGMGCAGHVRLWLAAIGAITRPGNPPPRCLPKEPERPTRPQGPKAAPGTDRGRRENAGGAPTSLLGPLAHDPQRTPRRETPAAPPEGERQSQRGAGLLASLRHPSLPRLTDHFVIPGEGQYLVMDFIPGEDARSLLERRGAPTPQAEVLRWAREILDALIYLHTRPQPVIHRDVKPGNIKITPDGRAILVDFGLAQVHDPTTHTTVGAKALTPGFAPPEQYGQGRTDARSDIYSLAATLYYLLTAQMPADGLEGAMGQKRLAPLLEINPTVSPHVAAAIERALALEPQGRFASAQELAEALFHLAQPEASPATLIPAQAGVSVAPPEAKPARRRPSPGRDRLLIPVLIVVFLLGAGSTGAGLLGGVTRGRGPTPTQSFSPGTTLPVVALGEDLTPTPTASQRPTLTQAPSETPAPSASPTPAGTPLGGG